MYRSLGYVYKNVGTNPISYIDRFISMNFTIGSSFVLNNSDIINLDYKDILYTFDSRSTCNQCLSCWESLGLVQNLGSKYVSLFRSDDNNLLFKSKFNLFFVSNNKLVNEYRDSIIFKILSKNLNIDVVKTYGLRRKMNKNGISPITNNKIASHFGKYEKLICRDEHFVRLLKEIYVIVK